MLDWVPRASGLTVALCGIVVEMLFIDGGGELRASMYVYFRLAEISPVFLFVGYLVHRNNIAQIHVLADTF